MQPLMLTTMFGGGENYVSFIEHGKWLYYNTMKIFYYYYILFTLYQCVDGTNLGEPKALQQEIAIMHVDALSSTMVHPIVLAPCTTSIWNETLYDKQGLTSDMSNFSIKLVKSRLPIASKSALLCEGQLCKTSKEDIAHGVWENSSTIE